MSETTQVKALSYGVDALYHAPSQTWQFKAGDQHIGIDREELVRLVAADALTAAQADLATVSREHAALVEVVLKADERIASLAAENAEMREVLRSLGAPREDATRFVCINESVVWDSDRAYRTPEITTDQRRAQAELIVRCRHAKRVKYLDSALAQEAGK